MKFAADTFGQVDILVNNAGIQHVAKIEDFPIERWDAIIAINMSSAFHATRLALPAMKAANWGRIINVASIHGLVGSAEKSAYVAAKHGVVGLTKALALELARKGVTVNAICPGYTETEIVREAVQNIVAKTGKSEAEARQALAASNPQQRMVQPQEVAQSVLWLCAAGSDAINGQAIAIDGGELAG